MSKIRVPLFLALVVFLFGLFCIGDNPALAGDETVILWGEQKAGSGHAKNAEQDGNTVEVKNSAEILKVEGTAKSYCIWKVGGYRGLLCGGKGKESIIGKTLNKGKYIVRAGLSKGQSKAKVSITLKLE